MKYLYCFPYLESQAPQRMHIKPKPRDNEISNFENLLDSGKSLKTFETLHFTPIKKLGPPW